MTLWDALWREINSPEGGTFLPEYTRAVTFGGHVLLGACFAGLGMWWVGFPIAAAYWLVKEAGDLRRGGKWWDGIEDMAGVWLGSLYGPAWWPLATFGMVAAIFVTAVWRRVR